MKPAQALGSVALLFLVAIASTVTGMKVSERADYVDSLHKQIKDDSARIQVLRTELAYLSSPQRIQALVDLHRPDLATPDSRQYVLNVRDVLPEQPVSPHVQPAVVKNMPRAQADQMIAISLPKAAPTTALPAQEDSIGQIIATAEAPTAPPATQEGLSSNLLATVQNVAAKDVMGQ